MLELSFNWMQGMVSDLGASNMLPWGYFGGVSWVAMHIVP